MEGLKDEFSPLGWRLDEGQDKKVRHLERIASVVRGWVFFFFEFNIIEAEK